MSLGSCTFAVQHPAATAAIVGGTLGGVTCEVGTDFDEHAACGGVALGAAALLGGVVLLATALGGPGDTVLREPSPDELQPEPPSIDEPTDGTTPAAPAPDQPAPDAAPAPAPTSPASPAPPTTEPPPAPTP